MIKNETYLRYCRKVGSIGYTIKNVIIKQPGLELNKALEVVTYILYKKSYKKAAIEFMSCNRRH